MHDPAIVTTAPPPAQPGARTREPRRPYEPPRLEPVGSWRSLTLQQSVPIGPGGFLLLQDPAAYG